MTFCIVFILCSSNFYWCTFYLWFRQRLCVPSKLICELISKYWKTDACHVMCLDLTFKGLFWADCILSSVGLVFFWCSIIKISYISFHYTQLYVYIFPSVYILSNWETTKCLWRKISHMIHYISIKYGSSNMLHGKIKYIAHLRY